MLAALALLIITITNPGTTTYTDTGTGAFSWCYLMTSVNSAGVESDQTGVVCAKPQSATPNQLTITWTLPTSNKDGSILTNLAGFKIYRTAPPSLKSFGVQ